MSFLVAGLLTGALLNEFLLWSSQDALPCTVLTAPTVVRYYSIVELTTNKISLLLSPSQRKMHRRAGYREIQTTHAVLRFRDHSVRMMLNEVN